MTRQYWGGQHRLMVLKDEELQLTETRQPLWVTAIEMICLWVIGIVYGLILFGVN